MTSNAKVPAHTEIEMGEFIPSNPSTNNGGQKNGPTRAGTLNSGPKQEGREELPKPWNCGTPYEHPIPTPNKDPFDVCLQPFIQTDKMQCELWKDEVQYLLIFAGLFSSVVTAFVIESSKLLQRDKEEVSITLLSHIAASLESIRNDTTMFTPRPEFSEDTFAPTASSMRVNVFWFISLMLSLATVLVGITCLQWLREHQRYPRTLTSKQALSLFHMRFESLERWYVPHVLTGLPFLLQLALIFFLVGIVDLVQGVNKTVAIPIAVLVSLILLFSVLTTLLPTLQCYTTSLPLDKSNPSVSTPCPYKSPQAWVVLRLFTISKPVFLVLHTLIMSAISRVYLFGRNDIEKDFTTCAPARNIYQLWGHSVNWMRFELGWVEIRTWNAAASQDWTLEGKPGSTQEYDAGRLIVQALKQYSFNEKVMVAAYHCFQQLSPYILIEDKRLLSMFRDQVTYRRRYEEDSTATESQFTLLSSLMTAPFNNDMTQDEKALLFLQALPSRFTLDPTHIFGCHQLEVTTRLFRALFGTLEQQQSISSDIQDPCLVIRNSEILLPTLPGHDSFIKTRLSLSYSRMNDWTYFQNSTPEAVHMRYAFLEQRLATLFPFISLASKMPQIRGQKPTSLHMSPYTEIYMNEIEGPIDFILTDTSSPEYRRLQSYLVNLNESLTQSLTSDTGDRNGLYYCSRLYFRCFRRPLGQIALFYSQSMLEENGRTIRSLANLLRAIHSYENLMDIESFLAVRGHHRGDESPNDVRGGSTDTWEDLARIVDQAEWRLDQPEAFKLDNEGTWVKIDMDFETGIRMAVARVLSRLPEGDERRIEASEWREVGSPVPQIA